MPSLLGSRTLDVNIRSAPQMREYELIAGRLGADRPARVLDWGCGAGQMTALLRSRGLDVTAYDYRPGLAAPVVEPLPHYPDVHAHLSSEPVALPFADRAFDAVLSCGVLEHVQDPDASLEELKRVLEPGGTLYVYKLPNRHSYLEWIARTASQRFGRGIYYHGMEPFDRIYDERSARALLERHGYRVRELALANMLPLTLPGPIAARLAGAIWWVNRELSRVPGLRRLATNVELVAAAP